MHTILCMFLLWQTCAPRCMPRLIGLPCFTSPLRWQTCTPLCMPRPFGLPYFTSSLLWQTCVPLRMPHQIHLPYLTLLLLCQTWTPLCMPRQIGLPFFTLSLRWLAFTPFTCSCCWLTPFLILTRLLHCLCCCSNSSRSCNRHDTNPPWYKLKAIVDAENVRPKYFAMMILWCEYIRCKTQTWKCMCGCLPGKKIVYSVSNVTTCSSVYQTCHVVVNSMLRQQGDNTVIMYQSCHATATVKQDDSYYSIPFKQGDNMFISKPNMPSCCQ